MRRLLAILLLAGCVALSNAANPICTLEGTWKGITSGSFGSVEVIMQYALSTWREAVQVTLNLGNSTCQCISAAEGTYNLTNGVQYSDVTTDCLSAGDCPGDSCTCPPKNLTYTDTIAWANSNCNQFTIDGASGNVTFVRVPVSAAHADRLVLLAPRRKFM